MERLGERRLGYRLIGWGWLLGRLLRAACLLTGLLLLLRVIA